MAVPGFEEIADRLYALPPADFTRARNQRADQARRAGDRALAERIRALRRPTVSAHALNLLVRTRRELVEQVLALGRELREAQSRRQGVRFRELSAQRNQLVTATAADARRAAEESGLALGSAAVAEIEESLRAVLADETAAQLFTAGHLHQALTPGFALPDAIESAPRPLSAATPAAAATRGQRRTPSGGAAKSAAKARKARRRAEAEAAAAAAQAARRDADAELAHRRDQAELAAERRRLSEVRLYRAERVLAEAREEHERVRQQDSAARRELAAAERQAAEAARTVATRERALERLGE
jgi:hypothetical protein